MKPNTTIRQGNDSRIYCRYAELPLSVHSLYFGSCEVTRYQIGQGQRGGDELAIHTRSADLTKEIGAKLQQFDRFNDTHNQWTRRIAPMRLTGKADFTPEYVSPDRTLCDFIHQQNAWVAQKHLIDNSAFLWVLSLLMGKENISPIC